VTVARNLYGTVKQYLTTRTAPRTILSGYTDNVYFSTAAGGLVGLYGPPHHGATSIVARPALGQRHEQRHHRRHFPGVGLADLRRPSPDQSCTAVQPQTPPAISGYTEDSSPANGQDNSVNAAHQMIEPDHDQCVAECRSALRQRRRRIPKIRHQVRHLHRGQSDLHRAQRPLPDGTLISIPARKYRAFAHNTTTNAVYEIVLPGPADYGTNNATINRRDNLNIADQRRLRSAEHRRPPSA